VQVAVRRRITNMVACVPGRPRLVGRGRLLLLTSVMCAIVACSAARTDAERIAAASYAQAADIADRRVHENDVQLDATPGAEQDFRDFYGRWAEIEHEFVASVARIPMPSTLASDLAAVTEAYGNVEAILRQFDGTPFAQWDPVRHELDHASVDAEAASNGLRAKLGLPSVQEAQPT